MKMLTTTVARVLFAVPFAVFGIMHFGNASAMAAMVPLPGGVFWIYLTGAGLLAASISIIIQKYTKIATLLLAAMLGVFILTMHIPGLASSEMVTVPQMQLSMGALLKDLGLAAAALLVSGMFAEKEAAQK